jgi:hypothetical protein
MPLLVPLLVLSAAVLVLEWVSISDSVANSMKSKRWTAERSTTMQNHERLSRMAPGSNRITMNFIGAVFSTSGFRARARTPTRWKASDQGSVILSPSFRPAIAR